jgi:DNA polymerase-3 subunit delta
VLVVSTWASNTRLYKQVDQSGLQIECRAPDRGGRSKAIDTPRIEKWLIQWCEQRHAARLRPDAAKQLLELVGPEFGLLDQELAKLVLYIEPGGEISRQLVDDVVGGWRAKTIWEVVDAATEGNTAEALTQLDRLLQGGENPLALFGQLAWSLRRYAAATRCFERAEAQGGRISLDEALIQAGFPKWSPSVLDKSKQQLQQLGRRRAGSLFRWLLETDLALKGSHSSPPRARLALELLVMRMSGQLPR